jgi:transposase
LLKHLSRQDIAYLVGATRQWVTRTLSDFDKERLIACKKRSILLLNEKKLELLAHFYQQKPLMTTEAVSEAPLK